MVLSNGEKTLNGVSVGGATSFTVDSGYSGGPPLVAPGPPQGGEVRLPVIELAPVGFGLPVSLIPVPHIENGTPVLTVGKTNGVSTGAAPTPEAQMQMLEAPGIEQGKRIFVIAGIVFLIFFFYMRS